MDIKIPRRISEGQQWGLAMEDQSCAVSYRPVHVLFSACVQLVSSC